MRRAIELKPGYVLAHDWYGYCLAEVGRFDEAYAELKQALELDPLSVAINSDLGSYFYWSRQFDKAIEQLQKTLELDHEARPPRVFLILSYAQKSQFVEALNQAQKLKETIAYVDALAGQRKEAQGLLDELKTRSKTEYIPPDAFALIYTGLGEKDLAFEWWRKSCEIRSS